MDNNINGDAFGEVESSLKEPAEASSNLDQASGRLTEMQCRMEAGVVEDSVVTQKIGSIKDTVVDPAEIGYLSLTTDCLTYVLSKSDSEKENSVLNGCELETEEEKNLVTSPSLADINCEPEKVYSQGNNCASKENSGLSISDNTTEKTLSSSTDEKNSLQIDKISEYPLTQIGNIGRKPYFVFDSHILGNEPERGSSKHAEVNPLISVNSGNLHSGSIVEGDDLNGVSPNGENVSGGKIQIPLVDRDKCIEKGSLRNVICEENVSSVPEKCQSSDYMNHKIINDDINAHKSSEKEIVELGVDTIEKSNIVSSKSSKSCEANLDQNLREMHSDLDASNKHISDMDSSQAEKESTVLVNSNSSVMYTTPPSPMNVTQTLAVTSLLNTAQPHCQFSPSKSTARKSVPGGNLKMKSFKATARKTGQPQTAIKALTASNTKESSGDTIKIVNLRPNSNITLKLSELEEVLKIKDKSKVNHSVGLESVKKEEWENCATADCIKTVSNVPCEKVNLGLKTTTSDTVQNSEGEPARMQLALKVHHKRRRKKGGTYDFPGGKKNPKKKKGFGSTSDCGFGRDFKPLRKFITKPIGSPHRQYTVVELLKNRPFHRRPTTHEILMRRKLSESPLRKKTVSQILKDRRKSVQPLASISSEGKTVSQLLQERRNLDGENCNSGCYGDKRMVQKLFVTKEGLVSSVNVEDVSERENLTDLKRKMSDGGSWKRSYISELPAPKKQKTGETAELHPPLLQPMVMVVAQHSQNAPGLRSILPKPHMTIAVSASSLTSSSGPSTVMVSAGQKLLFSAPSLLVKSGTKVALVPTSGKSTFSLLPTTVVPSSIGVGVPISAMPSQAKLMTIRPSMSQSLNKNSEALRALLASPNGPRPKMVSIIPSSLQAAQVMSFPSSSSASVSFAQTKVLTSSIITAKPCGNDGKVVSSLPNGLLLPVTPPKTPEGEAASDGITTVPSHDSDAIPLCCCKILGAFTRLSSGVTYCQALDSVDGKVLGCCNKVSNLQLVRPGVKIPFMAVCEVHRKRLKLHQCCPGCGHFCTQGKFYQCRKEGSSIHHFHRQCQAERDGRLFCPHCGEESGQFEVNLTLNDAQPVQSAEQIRANLRKSIAKARMTSCSLVKKKTTDTKPGVTITLPSSKTISSGGLPFGLDREHLEKLMHLCTITAERPKRYRVLPKSMYGPATEGDLEKVFYMLMDGIDPNEVCEEEDGQTVLHGAVYSGNVTLVYLLIQAGACLHTPDKTLKTPLMCAAEHGHVAILKMLAKAGARLDDKGEDHMTCLHYAAKAGHMEIIQYILDTDAIGINAADEGGWTPIMWATESQLANVVKYLVSRGGDPNKKDNEENTALHWAAFAGSLEITELFLDLGCELDTPNEHGDRPLHIAARQDHYEVVVILLARGANVDLKNNKDETPVACCPDMNSQVCMALKVNKQLRSFAAKLSRPEKLVHRDVSLGREKNPIACVNAVDDDPHPSDYLYVNHNVETQDLHINYVITSLQSCRCKDDCSSVYCVCSRSSVTCWFDKFGRLLEDFNLLDPPLIFECNRACRCWVNCNNRVVQNGITVRMQVFRTIGRGWGVRSLMDIPKGTFICEYIGELISDSEADRREDDSYLFDLDNKDGDTYCLDARKYGNVARFINHLCEPNLVPVKVFVEHQDLRFPRICFFASRNIKPYEELGFDYGEKFWIIKWKQFTCSCGSIKCKYSSETIKRTLEEYRLRHEDENVGQDS